MDFDDVYSHYRELLEGAVSRERASQQKLESYMRLQDEEVLEAERRSGRKVSIGQRPSLSVDANGMDFSWRFWTGVGHHNHPDQAEMKLTARFKWSPSDPDVVCVSGIGIVEGTIDVDDFIDTSLTEQMALAMSESLLARAKVKHPHID